MVVEDGAESGLDHVASDEVVVVDVERATDLLAGEEVVSPLFVQKLSEEAARIDDGGSQEGCSSGNDEEAAVDVGRSSGFEVCR